MKKVNRSRFALLGLLGLQPMTGYEIKGWIAESIGYFWSESYGQIYPQLKKLVTDGLARVEAVPDEARTKKRYHITEAGREALETWLKEPTPPVPLRLEFLLKIFFGHQTEVAHTVDLLRHEAEQAQELETALEAIQARFDQNCDPTLPVNQMSLITIDYGLGLARHTRTWAEASLKRLQTQTPEE